MRGADDMEVDGLYLVFPQIDYLRLVSWTTII